MEDEGKSRDELAEELARTRRRLAALEGSKNTTRDPAEGLPRESEERYRLLVDSAKDYAIFALSTDGRIADWNLGAERVFGYRQEEIVGRPVSALFTPEDVTRGAHEEELRKAAAEGRAEDERWHLRKDGTRFFASGFVRPVRDEEGNLRGFAKVARDVTERREAEEALRRQAELLELSHEPIFAWELRGGGIVYWNHGSEELYGFSREEAVGSVSHRLLGTVHPVPLERFETELERDGRWVGELEHTTRDGRRVVVESRHAVVDTSDGRRLVLETNRDVTERRRAERALEESEGRLRDILDNSPTVVYAKDPEGRFLMVNRRFEELFGVGRYEVLGKTDHDLFPEEAAGRFRANDEEVLRSGAALEAEEAVPQKDGEHTYLSVKFPLRDASGALYAVCGISADITGRRRAEEELGAIREAERRRISRDLHDGVLQDLSGALQALQLTRLRAQRSGLDLGLREEIEALRRAAGGLRGAVHDLRLQGERPFVGAVEDRVESERRLEPEREVRLIVQEGFPEELPEALGTELLRVLREALTNARKHSGARRVEVVLSTAEGRVQAEVADDGRGFEPDETSAAPGGGVGLSTMRERVEALGGTFEVQSLPGEGTRVTVRVPFS